MSRRRHMIVQSVSCVLLFAILLAWIRSYSACDIIHKNWWSSQRYTRLESSAGALYLIRGKESGDLFRGTLDFDTWPVSRWEGQFGIATSRVVPLHVFRVTVASEPEPSQVVRVSYWLLCSVVAGIIVLAIRLRWRHQAAEGARESEEGRDSKR